MSPHSIQMVMRIQSYIFFMEKVSLNTYIGLALCAAGVYIARQVIERRSRKEVMQEVQSQEAKMDITDLIKKYSTEFNGSKHLEKIIPRVFDSEASLQNLTSNLFYRKRNSHLDSLTKSLSEPIWDLLDRGGKRWRPVLCMLIAEMYGHKREEIYDIAALCQIIHNGTLIVDDIQDSSLQRRGKDCVHLIYGMDISVNAGNFMYFAPLLYLLKNSNFSKEQTIKVGQVYAEEMTNLHLGQGWDILWHNIDKLKGNYPSENDYLQMTAHKTGVLARLSARLTCIYLGLGEEETKVLARFAETMGVAFQIQDDLLNLEGGKLAALKGFNGEDIHEGKMTLMVLHFLQEVDPTRRDRLIEILKKKTEEEKEIKEAIDMMSEAGSLAYAKKKMYELIEGAWKDVEQNLPDNVYRQYMYDLAFFSIQRSV